MHMVPYEVTVIIIVIIIIIIIINNVEPQICMDCGIIILFNLLTRVPAALPCPVHWLWPKVLVPGCS